ncbi:MAG: complex I NDUFA9 subunit family protein [Alphaproteobacteria bacterium]
MATRSVTIFGGSGFIGRHVVRLLAARGDLVRVAVRDTDSALFLKPMGDVGQVTPVAAPIGDDARVAAACHGADLVINLVGILYERGRQRFHTVHVEGARRVVQAARQAGATGMVHMSALGADPHSDSDYAASKAAGEAAVREAFPEAVILRPSVVFGPEDDFFNRFAAMARLAPALPVVGVCPTVADLKAGRLTGDGGPKFQPVYVGDLAEALVRAAADPAAAGKTYELGGPKVYSFQEVLELVLRHVARKRPLVPMPFFAAGIFAGFAGLLPKPPLTRDQLRLLHHDNVVSGGQPGFADLGIVPIAPEAVLPRYLDRFRPGGRFTARHA